jgi:AAA15 family ATPase/GTPase
MLKSLKIKNFRCFEEFDLPQLGRVNLLVGKNNSGKTSILEALHILNSPNTIKPFSDIIESRGEYSWNQKNDSRNSIEPIHLFFGHRMNDDSDFEISGVTNEDSKIVFLFCLSNHQQAKDLAETIEQDSKVINLQIINASHPGQFPVNNYVLEWQGSKIFVIISDLSINVLNNRIVRISNQKEIQSSQLVSLTSSDLDEIISQFDQIVLTPQEEILYESLRIIEPGIERIAPINDHRYQDYRNGGFVVSINKQRVPIGSMGYGIWRMLEITLAMVNIPGGTLLIDEIDTGLHFSVMIDLWKLICKTAEKLDIQVFATTHNSDCWKSLAEVANSDDIASDDITIHRIERGKKASIVFNEQEMAIAADRDIEVR